MNVNYKSDFELPIVLSTEGRTINFPDLEFELIFTTDGATTYKASHRNGEYTNCYIKDGVLVVRFDKHGLGIGDLLVDMYTYTTDEAYKSKTRVNLDPSVLNVQLVDGMGDTLSNEQVIVPSTLYILDLYQSLVNLGYKGSEDEFLAMLLNIGKMYYTDGSELKVAKGNKANYIADGNTIYLATDTNEMLFNGKVVGSQIKDVAVGERDYMNSSIAESIVVTKANGTKTTIPLMKAEIVKRISKQVFTIKKVVSGVDVQRISIGEELELAFNEDNGKILGIDANSYVNNFITAENIGEVTSNGIVPNKENVYLYNGDLAVIVDGKLKSYNLQNIITNSLGSSTSLAASQSLLTKQLLDVGTKISNTERKMIDYALTSIGEMTNNETTITMSFLRQEKGEPVYVEAEPQVFTLEPATSEKAGLLSSTYFDAIVGNSTRLDRLEQVVQSGEVVYEAIAEKIGKPNGIAPLDEASHVPSEYLPSYVDDVVEYDSFAMFPKQGEGGKIYVDKKTNLTYRWSGTAYVEISKSIGIGTTDGTAYSGASGAKNASDIADLKTQYNQLSTDVANNVFSIEIDTNSGEIYLVKAYKSTITKGEVDKTTGEIIITQTI